MKKLLIFLILLLPISVRGLDIARIEIEKPEDLSYENENFYEKNRELILREDSNLYSSPDSEDIVGKVKVGDKFIFKYLFNNRAYIDDGKKEGWIELKDKDFIVESLDSFIVVKKTKLTCATIPANTIVDKPYAKDFNETKIIIEYKGCTEVVNLIDNDSIVSINQYNSLGNYVLLKKEYKMYEEADTKSNVLDTVPKSAIVKKIAYVYDLKLDENDIKVSIPKELKIYIEYKGKKGWLIVKHEHYQAFENEKDAIKYRRNNAIIKIIIDALLIVVLVVILIVRSKKRNEKNS